jgi:hypothetical protein
VRVGTGLGACGGAWRPASGASAGAYDLQVSAASFGTARVFCDLDFFENASSEGASVGLEPPPRNIFLGVCGRVLKNLGLKVFVRRRF